MLGLVPVTIATLSASFMVRATIIVATEPVNSSHPKEAPVMPSVVRWVLLPALVSLVLGCHAGARQAAPSPPPVLADLVRGYDDELAPYNPFTASEAGLRQYDRVLANDIGGEYRRGMLALCTRYRDELGRLDPARLAEAQRVTYDVLLFRVTACVDDYYRFPWHLLPVNQG